MSTIWHLALAVGLVYLVVCAAWWVIFWWDALDAELEATSTLDLDHDRVPAWEYRERALARATYARAQKARFYAAPWLIVTGQARRNPPRHRH